MLLEAGFLSFLISFHSFLFFSPFPFFFYILLASHSNSSPLLSSPWYIYIYISHSPVPTVTPTPWLSAAAAFVRVWARAAAGGGDDAWLTGTTWCAFVHRGRKGWREGYERCRGGGLKIVRWDGVSWVCVEEKVEGEGKRVWDDGGIVCIYRFYYSWPIMTYLCSCLLYIYRERERGSSNIF